MEIHHNTDHFFLFLVVVTLLSIVGFLTISISADEQHILMSASQTIGVILLICTGIILAIYGYQEYKMEDSIYDIISSIA